MNKKNHSYLYALALSLLLAVGTAHGQPAGPPGGLDVSVVPSFEPFQIIAQNGDSNPQSLSVEIFVVPAGKRLIIEYVGWQTTVEPGEIAKARIATRVDGNFTFHRLGVQSVGNAGVNGGVIMEDGKLVKLFSDPETTVTGQVFTGPNGTVENVIFSISGFLVDVE